MNKVHNRCIHQILAMPSFHHLWYLVINTQANIMLVFDNFKGKLSFIIDGTMRMFTATLSIANICNMNIIIVN